MDYIEAVAMARRSRFQGIDIVVLEPKEFGEFRQCLVDHFERFAAPSEKDVQTKDIFFEGVRFTEATYQPEPTFHQHI